MDEIRRFLRYTLPGLAATLIVLGSLWLSGAIPAGWMGGDNLLAKFAGIFVASGALGYFLANLYFAVRWFPFFEKWLIIDHKSVIMALGEVLEVRGPSDQPWKLANLTLFDAWSVLTHYCVSRPKTDDHMTAIVDHTKAMVDVTHGLGALSTGVGLATLAVLVLGLSSPDELRIWTAFALLLVLSLALWFAFLRSLRALESISNTAFVTSIRTQYQGANNTGPKVYIYYERDDATSVTNKEIGTSVKN
jgi:hypothetical protein